MGHWYRLDGTPQYTIIGANGKERDCTLRDGRKLNLVPSVTEILKVASSDALTEWKVNQCLALAAKNPYDPVGGASEQWASAIKDMLKEEVKVTSDKGSEIHDALEVYYKTGKVHQGYIETIKAVDRLLLPLSNEWIAEESMCYKTYYGGKVDIHSKKDNIIIDFKTKNTNDFAKVKGYSNHKMQLAAYAYGLKIPEAKTGNIWIDVRNPGIVKLEMYTEEEKNQAWDMFNCLLQYWRLDKNFHL